MRLPFVIVRAFDRLAAQHDRLLRGAREACGLRGPREHLGVTGAERERTLVVQERRVVGEHRGGVGARLQRGRERLRGHPRPVAVVGALRSVLELVRDAAVQRAALHGQQPLVEHFADQPVPERHTVAVAHEHTGVQRRPHRLRGDGEALEQRVRRASARRRQQVEQAGVEPRDPGQHGLFERRLAHREELFDKERVAAGAPVQLLRDRLVDRTSGQPLGQLRDLREGQRPQFGPRHGAPADELAHEPPDGGRELIVDAVGRHHHDPLRAQVRGQEREQRERGVIGPVDVLEDQQHGRVLGLAAELAEQQFEERVGALRARQAPVSAQRRHHRTERQCVTPELEALAAQDGEAGCGGLQLTDQPCLPDPRFAGHEPQRGMPGRGFVERSAQGAHRRFTSNHRSMISDRRGGR